jgi:hypothetical protein
MGVKRLSAPVLTLVGHSTVTVAIECLASQSGSVADSEPVRY